MKFFSMKPYTAYRKKKRQNIGKQSNQTNGIRHQIIVIFLFIESKDYISGKRLTNNVEHRKKDKTPWN